MKDKIKRPRLKREWEGLIVQTHQEHITNGGNILPPGEYYVNQNYRGLELQSVEACKDCRMKWRHTVKGVSEDKVTVLRRATAADRKKLRR